MCFRSTPADPNAFPVCSKVLSLDDCRFKSVFYVLKRALARRSSIQMCFLYAQMCARSTRVDPNACPMCPDAFSLDACQPKCVFYALRCALARRLSIQMRFRRRACTYKSSSSCMVWTAIWDAQNGLIQIWRTGGELTHKNDQIHVWFGQPSGMPQLA